MGRWTASFDIFWGAYYDGGSCIPRPMQMVESGIVLAVAVTYFPVAANEDSAGLLAAVDLGAL